MTALEDSRYTDEALEWAEKTVGGTITKKEIQDRWRPHWFLDIERPDGTIVPVLLRGFRSPIADNVPQSRERLRMEAHVCKALQNTGVKVARYYGYEPKGGWFLMERVSGTHYLTRVEDKVTQFDLFRQYIENVAFMHSLDYRTLDLPDGVPVSKTYEEGASHMLKRFRAPYDNCPHKDPEPLFELSDWWLAKHSPAPVERFSFTTGDIGADQFMFEGKTFKAMFDLEYSHVGDPLQDIGLMRKRDLSYPVPGLAKLIYHWHECLGLPFDKTSVSWWTIASFIGSPMFMYPHWVKPDPTLVTELAHILGAMNGNRRGTAEVLAEFYGFDLTTPELPELSSDRFTRYHELLRRQLTDYHVAEAPAEKKYALRCSAAFAETNLMSYQIGPELIRQNIADLATTLGVQPASEKAGLAALQERIKRDPERDLERVVRILYNIECRTEFLFAPLHRVSGLPTLAPLQRLW